MSLWRSCACAGRKAAGEIAEAIADLNNLKNLDLIMSAAEEEDGGSLVV